MRITKAAALLVLLGWMCVSPPPALAQGALVVTITSPTSGSTVSGTIPVNASVSAGFMIRGVQFKLDGANLGAEDTTAPYSVPWNTTTASNGSHTLTAYARDMIGVQYISNPVTVTVSNTAPPPPPPPPPPTTGTATRFEETELATTYTTGWVHRFTGLPFSLKTAALSWTQNASATFTFTGTSVKWIGFRGPQTGIALVFLDGIFQQQIDTYQPTEELEAVIFTASGLANGTHTLRIDVTGMANSAATASNIMVDAFDVEPSSPLPIMGKRFEETNASASYTSGWTPGDTTASWSNGTATDTTQGGAMVNFTFTGTSVNWIGYRGPDGGIARVYVDGTLVQTVDAYAPRRLQAVVFSVSQLPAGSHTLGIEGTGQRNAAATDSRVVVDAFDTRTRFEENHPSIVLTSPSTAWELTVSRAWSEKNAVFTWVTGATATLTFNGTSVRWISYRGPIGGIARVYLDGAFMGTIDTYASADQVQTVLFSAAGLPAGTHTLRIEVTGTQNPLSTKPFILIDCFDID